MLEHLLGEVFIRLYEYVVLWQWTASANTDRGLTSVRRNPLDSTIPLSLSHQHLASHSHLAPLVSPQSTIVLGVTRAFFDFLPKERLRRMAPIGGSGGSNTKRPTDGSNLELYSGM